MKSLLCISFLLIILSASGNGQPLGHDIIGGYDEYKWGTPFEEMATDLALEFVGEDSAGFRTYWSRDSVEIGGQRARHGFGFAEGKLVSTQFVISVDVDFERLLEIMEECLADWTVVPESRGYRGWVLIEEDTGVRTISARGHGGIVVLYRLSWATRNALKSKGCNVELGDTAVDLHSNAEPLGHEILGGFDQYKWGTPFQVLNEAFTLQAMGDGTYGTQQYLGVRTDSLGGVEVRLMFSFYDGKLVNVGFFTLFATNFDKWVQLMEEMFGEETARDSEGRRVWEDLGEDTFAVAARDSTGTAMLMIGSKSLTQEASDGNPEEN